jgi:hypothetical protein
MIPLILLFVVENILPPSFFTFRTWEAVRSKTPLLTGPFYPNIEYKMIEEGDLAHHTNYAVKKKVSWKTDKLGYRNDHYDSSPDVLFIGDSNITGSSLSQEEILSSMLKHTGLSVYNLAPGNVNIFIKLKNKGMFQPPRIVILGIIERSIPFLLPVVNTQSRLNRMQIQFKPFVSFFAMHCDKLARTNSIRYLRARFKGSVGAGIQSKIDKKIFFLQGSNAVMKISNDSMESILQKIKNYKKYFNSIGSEFIFLPIPNKETILWELAGFLKQPSFIGQLIDKLRSNRIITIDTLKIFNKLRDNGILPYHYDDTHCNREANNEIAKAIIKLLKNKALLDKNMITSYKDKIEGSIPSEMKEVNDL